MEKGNVKVTGEKYISHPVMTVWQAFLRWKSTNLGTTIGLILLAIAVFFLSLTIVMSILIGTAVSGMPSDPAQFWEWILKYGLLAIAIGAAVIIVATLPFGIAIDYAFISSQNKRKIQFGAALKRGYSRLFVALGSYVVAFLFIIAGLVLLVIPGLYIALRLGYLNSVIANENLGPIESIRRSWALTKNNLWDILGAVSVNSVILSALGLIVSAAILVSEAANVPGVGVGISAIVSIVVLVLGVSTAAGVYFRYHQSALEKDGKLKKEGTDQLNYILFAAAVLLGIADNMYSAQPTTPTVDTNSY